MYFNNTTMTLNEWHHVATVYQNNKCSCYIDGELKGTADCPLNFEMTTGRLFIGSRYTGVNKFIGRVNDVRIYDEGLTQSDI